MIIKTRFCQNRIILFAALIIAVSISLVPFKYVFAEEPEPIIFLHYYSSSHGKPAMNKMVDTINKAHPEFHIKAASFQHEPFKIAIKAMLAGGNPPDIFTYWAGARVQALVDAGDLEPIDTLWRQAKMEKRFTPAIAQACTYNGKKYAIPLNQFYTAFFYNKKIFGEHGIIVPKTWEDFLTVCKQLKTAGIIPIALGSKNRWPAQFWFDYLLLRTAGPEYRQGLMTGNASYTDPEVKKAFILWKELADHAYFPPASNAHSWSDASKTVFHGQAAMTLMGNWTTALFDKLGWKQHLDYDFFPFPIIDPNTPIASVGPIDGVVLPKKGKGNSAKTVLAYFADAAPQKELSLANGSLAPNQNIPLASYTEIQQRILRTISKTPHWAFNYDLATPHPVAEAGLDSFIKFLNHPEHYLKILDELEIQAKNHFKKK